MGPECKGVPGPVGKEVELNLRKHSPAACQLPGEWVEALGPALFGVGCSAAGAKPRAMGTHRWLQLAGSTWASASVVKLSLKG